MSSVPVRLNESVYARVKDYSTLTGRSVTSVVSEALQDWLETVGEARQEAAESRTIEANAVALDFGYGNVVPIRLE